MFYNGRLAPLFSTVPPLLNLAFYALPIAMMVVVVWRGAGDTFGTQDHHHHHHHHHLRSPDRTTVFLVLVCVASVAFIVAVDYLFRWRQYYLRKVDFDKSVIYVTSESHRSHTALRQDVSIETIVAEGLLVKGMPAEEARRKVEMLLTYCEFQMFNQVRVERVEG